MHSKTRTSVQLGILLGLSGDSGDGMEGGGGSGDGIGRVGEGLCYALIQPIQCIRGYTVGVFC